MVLIDKQGKSNARQIEAVFPIQRVKSKVKINSNFAGQETSNNFSGQEKMTSESSKQQQAKKGQEGPKAD